MTQNKVKSSFQALFSHPSIQSFNPYSRAVFGSIASCHTAKLGYHLTQCDNGNCLTTSQQYHSCGNRHCPYCGSMKREEWVENRMNELLPTPYYHVVFTLPHELNGLVMGNRVILLGALFSFSTKTLLNHGRNPDFLGAEPGITTVLHTWGQEIDFHPHVHCIVTGGGFGGNGWVEAKRKNNKFLFPEKSLSSMYKALFLKELEQNTEIKWGDIDKEKLLKAIKYKWWNVYAKAPFGGPAQVIAYLGRYTHKIAITQHRIVDFTESHIKFKYRDYADGNKEKTMWLKKTEFLRRFEQHILPRKFVKIRHTGFLRNKDKAKRISLIRASIGLSEAPQKVTIPLQIRMLEKYGKDIGKCTKCSTGRLVLVHDTRAERLTKIKKLPQITGEMARLESS